MDIQGVSEISKEFQFLKKRTYAAAKRKGSTADPSKVALAWIHLWNKAHMPCPLVALRAIGVTC